MTEIDDRYHDDEDDRDGLSDDEIHMAKAFRMSEAEYLAFKNPAYVPPDPTANHE